VDTNVSNDVQVLHVAQSQKCNMLGARVHGLAIGLGDAAKPSQNLAVHWPLA